ncbi:hypothetical protein [Flavobacterium sp.]|uniref:hypothetical protein n=1 Tax=Flavobacterium sp. TaxID=239 RepID=UPI002FDB299D
MRTWIKKSFFFICILILTGSDALFCQVPMQQPPTTSGFNNFSIPNYTHPQSLNKNPNIEIPLPGNQQQQNARLIQEADRQIALEQKAMQEARADIEKFSSSIRYTLPSLSNVKGSELYRQVFDKIISIGEDVSLKDVVFDIENAYFDNVLSKEKFERTIQESGQFLIQKMKEQGYDLNSNAAKNFMLFQYFSETLQLKSTKEKHLPFTYDFDDYMGMQNHAKMFVTKLLETGSGQCHSMPLLYLMLADEIQAEAYLALSPNHSYIRFPDDKRKWYNIELTNGMFSTTSYILQSGYIKSEALQNKIYMENLSKKELLANLLTDLTNGYIHKFGYDEFVADVINKALSLYPNSIHAQMFKAKVDMARFDYVILQLGINPDDEVQRQKILEYPKVVQMLRDLNNQHLLIDNLGYEPMPQEAYELWLQAMKQETQKQENEAISRQLEKILPKQIKTIKD